MNLEFEHIKALLPKGARRNLTQGTVDAINNLTSEDGELFGDAYKENFVSYIGVLKTGRFKINDYMSAVKYVSYKLMEHTNIDSYIMTFPDRFARLKHKHNNLSDEDLRVEIGNFVAAYNKNELVNKILEQSMIPPHILNVPMFQQALNVSCELMLNASSEMVRITAAKTILDATKAPETSKIEIDLNLKESDAIVDLRRATQELVSQQKLALSSGVSNPKEIAESIVVIDAEIETIDAD